MITYRIEENKKLKVFEKLYVGYRDQSSGIKLGFMTPFETNTAGTKRKSTVDYWSDKKTEPVIFDNTAVEGFIITDDIKRVYFGGGNVVWRIYDPRGFELEISSNNLFSIIQTVGVGKGGVISGKCIWARDGSENILLHEDSIEFKNTVKVGTNLDQQVASIVKTPGKRYIMRDGSEVIYVGRLYAQTVGVDPVNKYKIDGNFAGYYNGEPFYFDGVLKPVNGDQMMLYGQGEVVFNKPILCDVVINSNNRLDLYKTVSFISEVEAEPVELPSFDVLNKMRFTASYNSPFEHLYLLTQSKPKNLVFTSTLMDAPPIEIVSAVETQREILSKNYASTYSVSGACLFNGAVLGGKYYFKYGEQNFCELLWDSFTNSSKRSEIIHRIILTKFDGVQSGCSKFGINRQLTEISRMPARRYGTMVGVLSADNYEAANAVVVFSGTETRIVEFLEEFIQQVSWFKIGVGNAK